MRDAPSTGGDLSARGPRYVRSAQGSGAVVVPRVGM